MSSTGVNTEANKEAAQDYIDLGNEAMRQMDLQRALKCYRKSASLVPNDALMKKIADIELLQRNMSSGSAPSPSAAAAPKRPPPPPPSQSASSSQKPPVDDRPFTDEQLQLVKKINKTKEFYQLLGLEKGADSSAISSAYRKVSTRVTDRNSISRLCVFFQFIFSFFSIFF